MYSQAVAAKVISVCAQDDLKPGEMRLVDVDGIRIGVFNCCGDLYAIEDRCTHDNGPLAQGLFEGDRCTVECPRHGSLFDLKTGAAKTLPAYMPADTFEVWVDGDEVKLEVE